jgi:hypothetical protein
MAQRVTRWAVRRSDSYRWVAVAPSDLFGRRDWEFQTWRQAYTFAFRMATTE